MEDLIEKYKQYKRDMDTISKKMEKTKQKIRLKLNEYPEKKYENETDVVYVKSMKRTSVSKKDVPEDFWEQYSVITQYDTLYVKEKN